MLQKVLLHISTSQNGSTAPGTSGSLWVGQMKTSRIFKAQDGSPSVVVDYRGVLVDGIVEREGDLVCALLQGYAKAAVFEREPGIGCAAIAVGIVVIFSLGHEFSVDEDPGVAEPAELDEFVLRG